MTDADPDDVGTLGEEAAKLFGALSGWAREQATDAGDGLSDLASQAASSAHDLNSHLATSAPECTVCPVCRTMHAVRQLSPEVTAHLTSAVSSLAQAAVALLATTQQSTPRQDRREYGVEHIDVAEDWPGG